LDRDANDGTPVYVDNVHDIVRKYGICVVEKLPKRYTDNINFWLWFVGRFPNEFNNIPEQYQDVEEIRLKVIQFNKISG
jgi:hypothetical protein